MAKHFLYLTNDKLIALMWNAGAIVERDVFAATDAATPRFAEYLAARRTTPAYLVTDLIEEDFRPDTVPHLRGNDRDAVLGRKLTQLYRATNFRHAIVQDREEEGRRDDRVLYHAVTNPDLLKPWLAALEEQSIPLEGVFSSAVLSVLLPRALDIFFTHTLVVTIVPDFGLRQTYFRNKQIKFSRLTPILYDEGQSVGELIAAETSRTWQYLDSLRHFAGDDTLEVCILVHLRDREMIADAIRAYPLLKYRFLDIDEVASKIKLKPAPNSSHAEEVLVHLFAQARLENHFADAQQTRFALFRRARIALSALTAGVLAAGVAATAFNLYQATVISGEIDSRNQAASRLQAEYQSISTEMRKQTSASGVARDASLFYGHQVRPEPAAPGAFINRLAEVISEFPRVNVLQINWMTSHDSAAVPGFVPVPAPTPPTVRSEVRVAAGAAGAAAAGGAVQGLLPPVQSNEANPPLAGNKFQVAVLEAAITPFDGRIRDALEEIDRFVARVNQLPGMKATLVVTPFDSRPAATITGAVTEQKSADTEARFAVKIVRTMEGR